MSRFNKSKPIFLLGIDLEIETVLPCALRHPAVAGGPGPKSPSGAPGPTQQHMLRHPLPFPASSSSPYPSPQTRCAGCRNDSRLEEPGASAPWFCGMHGPSPCFFPHLKFSACPSMPDSVSSPPRNLHDSLGTSKGAVHVDTLTTSTSL